MGYEKITRKWGDGYTYYQFHSARDTLYESDVFGDGTKATADSEFINGEDYLDDRAFDDDVNTYWGSALTALPHWIMYDLGSGNEVALNKIRLNIESISGYASVKAFQILGSNTASPADPDPNHANWTSLATKEAANTGDVWQDFTFTNTDTYRHYAIYVTSSWHPSDEQVVINEIQGMETKSEGEWTFAEMLANQTLDFGGTSAAAEITAEIENFTDEIQQEAFPVQVVMVGGRAQLKLTISTGGAAMLGIIAGLTGATSEDDILGTDDHADTVVFGVQNLENLSILHKVPNPHYASSGYYDYFYAPNCQIQGNVTLKFHRKEVRTMELLFNVSPSTQDAMALSNGSHAVYKFYHQSST